MKIASSFLQTAYSEVAVGTLDVDPTLFSKESFFIAKDEEIFKSLLRKIDKDRLFLESAYPNGVRPSNIIGLGTSVFHDMSYGTVEMGTAIYETNTSKVRVFVNTLLNYKESFIFAAKIKAEKDKAQELKKQLKNEKDKKKKEKLEKEIDALKYAKVSNIEFRVGEDIDEYSFFPILIGTIFLLNEKEMVVQKTSKNFTKDTISAFANFYNENKSFFNGKEIVSDKETIQKLFTKKTFEKKGEPYQPITYKYLSLIAEAKDYSSSSLVPEWEEDKGTEVEKPALPLPNAHLVNALTAGILQGELYTEKGPAIIKGSTVKEIRRNGDAFDEYFVNRQMVFYKDHYSLVRENSSSFIEANLRELHDMLKGIGSLVDPKDVQKWEPLLEELSRGARVDLPGQVVKTIGNFVLQEKYGFSIYNGEPGIGKTQVSFSVARLLSKTKYANGMKTVFICDGAKHLNKMMNEAGLVIGENAQTRVIRTLKDVDRLMEEEVPAGMVYVYVVSKDTAKRGISLKSMTNVRKCPTCGVRTTQKAVKELKEKIKAFAVNDLKEHAPIRKVKSTVYCSNCGDKLIIPANRTNMTGNFTWGTEKACPNHLKMKGIKPTESFGKYLRRKMKWKKCIDFLIVDEAHGMTADQSQQTQMMRDFIKVSRNVMLMTGTLSNGYASSLYYLLYAVMPKRMKEWGFDIKNKGVIKWIDSYGARKNVSFKNRSGVPQEKAIINPTLVMHHLAPFTVWGKIEDLNYPMPKYSEDVIVAKIEPEILESMTRLDSEVKDIIEANTFEDSKPSTSGIVKGMLYMSNNPFKEYTFHIKHKGDVIGTVNVPKVYDDETFLTDKERNLLEIIDKNLEENRKVMVYTYFNKTAFPQKRIAQVLEMNRPNISFAILPDSIKSEKIGDWFVSSSKKYDVVIVPYKRVATGLDIPQYPEVVFYEEEYNVRELQQAARRPYRAVIQKNPVHINFLVQEGPQAIAMHLISEKIAASKIVEGEVYSEDGVEAFAIDSIEIALKQRLADGIGNLETPDFATNEIEEGRARPWTSLEARYIELLKENNPEALALAIPDSVDEIEANSECDIENSIVADEEVEVVETLQEVEEVEVEPIVFGFEVITKGKRKPKSTKKGSVLELDQIKEELRENEKIQLTFF